MQQCSACHKKRIYMFTVAYDNSGLLACLYCVKRAACTLTCNVCKKSVGQTDGHSESETELFCVSCLKGSANLQCEKCGDDIGYLIKRRSPFKAFCVTCMKKVRKLKGSEI